ncbi:hypothetical protein [Halococcus sp. IIIV-5B]|uniref:hypothetical protein n=1 Tax=Halococcus sp. IIIV-5B TaxID=2321230 RepID=UPI001F372656|nr:hypothetical protein [Halococcus sp. IIIV-5B]
MIAAIISTATAVISTIAGVGVFALSLAAIYLRGYLVPGTPILTKRYLPDRVLRWFDKEPAPSLERNNDNIEVSTEDVLVSARAVEPCASETDLCLTSGFRKSWQNKIQGLAKEDINQQQLKSILSIRSDQNNLSTEEIGEGIVAYYDDTVISQWSSNAAITADIAAGAELDVRLPGEIKMNPAEMARVLMSLRVFIERCPQCGGEVTVDQEVVESCCRSYDVIASTCRECDTRLFELEWDERTTSSSEGASA